MARGSSESAQWELRTLLAAGTATGLTDGQLLERFVSQGGGAAEAAFAALLARHGPMVLSVCRKLLGDEHDAEDASQAAFLVLAHRAKAIRKFESVASWLYGVAVRVAARAKADAARRRAIERRGAEMIRKAPDDPAQPELCPELYEELERLPEAYRAPLVLCYLEGLSHEQAADHLRWPLRTVRSRLARGRERLRGRLVRRGVTLAAGLLATNIPTTASAAVPAAWAHSTLDIARRLAAGESIESISSARVAAWTKGAIQMMYVSRLTTLLAYGLVFGGSISLACLAAGVVATAVDPGPDRPAVADRQGAPKQAAPAEVEPAENPAGPVTLEGRIVDPAGKPVPGATIYVRHSRMAMPGEEGNLVERVAATGSDGRFQFKLDPAGDDLAVFVGFADRNDGPPWQSAVIATAAPGFGPDWISAGRAARQSAVLHLVRDDVPIRGRLLDTQGRPLRGVTVRVEAIAAARDVDLEALLATGSVNWDGLLVTSKFQGPVLELPTWIGQQGAVTTDATGRFEIKGIGNDRLALLAAEGDGLERARIAVLDRRGKTGIPARRSQPDMVYQHMELPLHAAEFEHVIGPSKPVTGVVREKGTGKPVAGVVVAGQIRGRPWSVVMSATDAEGRYRLAGLPKADSYMIDVRPEPGGPYLAAKTVASDTGGLRAIEASLELPQGVVVNGRIVDQGTGRAVAADGIVYVQLTPGRGLSAHGRPIGTNNAFRITVARGSTGVLLAKVRGRTHPYPAARLTKADSEKGLRDSSTSPDATGLPLAAYNAYRLLEIAADARELIVDLAVTAGRSRKGTLVDADGKPVDGAKALGLAPDPFDSQTMAGNAFEVLGLAPGEARRVEFVQENRGLAGTVTVDGSDVSDRPLTVALAPFGSLKGRLLDEDGLPLRGAKVSAHVRRKGRFQPPDPSFDSRDAVTDDSGRFRIERIAPGLAVRISIEDPNRPPPRNASMPAEDPGPITLEPGEVKDLGDISVRAEQVK